MSETMHSIELSGLNAEWSLTEVPRPEAAPGQVLVRVHASGICGTDVWITQGKLSFAPFPLTLGHEGVGEVVGVGSGVTTRAVGDRVGLVALQSGCGTCDWCRQHRPLDFTTAANCPGAILTGFNVNGAQADYIAVPADATVVLPEGLAYEQAAPIMCIGYTAWAALRRANPQPGARVAVTGIGGMGHLALQYAKAAGFTVLAVTGSADKHDLARELGADEVFTSGAELLAGGGADVLLGTSSSNLAIADAMQGVRANGTVMLMGISFDELPLTSMPMVMNSLTVRGSAHNGVQYLTEALQLVADGKVTPMIEVFDKKDSIEAYRRTAAGEARFRTVITYS